jgi:filamentous hemagglutinin family protein
MVAVAEIASGRGRSAAGGCVSGVGGASRVAALPLCIALAWGAVAPGALANPAGGVAVAGQASMVTQGNKLTVTTQNAAGANHSAINWQSFSIPQGNTTHFQQPSAASTVINRVVTHTPSQIFGTLSSNGHLVLVNQAGIAVGAGAVVDTAGFTASSLRMTDADALSGRMRFGDGAASSAGVSVNGSVLARSGDVVLLGGSVTTGADALIQSPNGSTVLAAGQQIELTGRGLEGIRLQVQAPADSVVNLGTLKGDAVGIFAGTLKHSGVIQATSASLEGGKVVLKAADLTEISGNVTAKAAGAVGGVIHASGGKVLVKGSSVLDASGDKGGGEVLVGGGWQGHDTRVSNAQQTVVATGAQIKVDALDQGNAGTAVVWADGATRFTGTISGRGGANGGNGGKAEVSGKQYLDFRGGADLTAPKGQTGLLLLDPDTIEIGTTAAVDGSTGDVTAGGLTNPGVASRITATQVSSLLATVDLTLQVTGDITVSNAITRATGGAVKTLTLNSTSGGVTLSAPISGTIGNPLGVSITSGGGAGISGVSTTITSFGGGVSMTSAANIIAPAITTAGGGLSLTANDVTIGNTINVGANNLSITSSGAVTQTAAITAAGLELGGAGSFTLTNAANNVAKIAASTGAGAISYVDANDLAVDTVNSVGISRAGDVTLSSGGLLTVGGLITTNSANLALTGTALAINSTIDAGFGFVSLDSSGSVTQTAAILAGGGLELKGAGSFTLNNSAGYVGKIAVSAGAGAITYVDGNDLKVDTVNGTAGIMRAGNVSLSSAGGNLTVGQSMNVNGDITLQTQSSTKDITFDSSTEALVIATSNASGTKTLTLNSGRDIVLSGLQGTTFKALGSTAQLDVALNPGAGRKVKTNSNSPVILDGSGGVGLVVAKLAAGKTWDNNGTLTLNGSANVYVPLGATFNNKSGATTDLTAANDLWVLYSTGENGGVVNNEGTLSVKGNSFSVEYNQGSTGILNITDGSLSLQNMGEVKGTVNLDATIANTQLWVSEVHSGSRTFIGTTFNRTDITGNTAKILVGDSSYTPQAVFKGVSASAVDLVVGNQGSIAIESDVGSGCTPLCVSTFKSASFTGSGKIDAINNGSFTLANGNIAVPATGVTYTGNAAYVASAGNITGTNISTGGANLTLTASGTITATNITTNGGNVNLAGSAVTGDGVMVTLTTDTRATSLGGNGGTVTATSTSGGVQMIDIDTSGSSGSNFTAGSGGSITVNAATRFYSNFRIQADATGSGPVNGGNVAITAGTDVHFRNVFSRGGSGRGGNVSIVATAGSIGADDQFETIQTNGVTGGNITLNGALGVNFQLGLNASGGSATNGDSTITLTSSGGSVTDTNTVSAHLGSVIADKLIVSANGVTLENSVNNVASLSIVPTGTSPISYWDTDAFSLGALTFNSATGLTLSLKSNGGNITQTGALVANSSGTLTTIDSGAGNITLTTASNDFYQLGTTSTGNVEIQDTNDIRLGASTAGSYKVTAGGLVDIPPSGTNSILSSAGGIEINALGGSVSIGLNVGATGGAVKFHASSGMTQCDCATVSSDASGDAVKYIVDTGAFTFISKAGSTTVSTPSGRWLAYLQNPGGHTFPASPNLPPVFKQYNAAYGDTVLGIGNGVLYNNTTPAVLSSTDFGDALTGSVSKVFDGSTSIGLSGATFIDVDTGWVDGDFGVNALISGGTGVLDDANAGTTKLVTVKNVTVSGISPVGGGFSESNVFGYWVKGLVGTVTAAPVVVRNEAPVVVRNDSVSLSGTRPYDGTNVVNGSIFSISGLVGSDTLLLSGSGTVADKNVGINKPVTLGTLALANGTGLASNYTLTGGTYVATITKAPITGVTGITATNRPYDGTVVAALTTSGAVFAGMFADDNLSVTSAKGAFENKNVGDAKAVTVADVVFGGDDLGNYSFGVEPVSTVKAHITLRPLSTWKGPASGGNWSTAANWDALPDAFNVAAVALPSGGVVVYDAAAGSTNLQSVSGGGTLDIAGGSLTVTSGVSLQGYQQTAGTLDTAGAFTVTNSFSQTGGTVVAGGAVSITQASGDLAVGSIRAPSITLNANGGISQSAGLVTAGLLTTQSGGGTVLNSADNRVAALKASSTGAGNIEFTNVGALDVRGLRTASGSIVLSNTGGISTSGPVVARGGKITGVANSPLTIGPDGVSADGDISLIATNLTSAGNITLNGPVVSSGGAIAVTAAANLTQNSTVSAALGVTAQVGGTTVFGPAASTVGSPVSYANSGVPTSVPEAPKTVVQEQFIQLTQSRVTVDLVETFSAKFEQAVAAQEEAKAPPGSPLRKKKEEENTVVAEAPICAR